jgi:hypothetical protein
LLTDIATEGEADSRTLAIGVLAVHVESMRIVKALRTLTDFATFKERGSPRSR